MAVFMNYLDDDCILIEDDDADDNIENIHGNQHNKFPNDDDDDEIEIVFDSAVLNNNNNKNIRKRPYSALNETNNKENRMAVIDLTDEDDEFNKYMKFRKRILKNFPGLCVNTINGLHSYKLISDNEKQERLEKLKENVRQLTTLSTARLEAWLMEKALVFQCQYCEKHKHLDGRNVKMTLLQVNITEGGGRIHKWNRPCCTGDDAVVSVNHRGFFDGEISPRSMLHLLHHWVTLDKLSNVEKFVHNVPLMNKIYHELRAVCTAAIHEHFEKFGGQRKVVEVCLMYVGVKNNLSNSKKLKVVIVGVYDVATKKKIVLALPPPMPQKTYHSSMAILTRFIDCQSLIVVDRSVSKSFFTGVGFENVFYPFIDGGIPVNNSKAVQSTRTVLHIFDVSLNLLSIEEIQLCLNELIWRETWGTHSLEAFNNFLAHVSELTKVIENFKQQSTVHSVLHKIVANPYGHWKYSTLESCFTDKPIKQAEQQVSFQQPISTEPESTEDVTSVSILEPYYYGTYPGDEVTVSEVDYVISCHLCTEKFFKNDLFIEHLVKHLLSKTCYDKIQVCTVCLKSFSNRLKLANHISNYHRNKPSKTSCLICYEDFSFRFRLLEHMKNTHVELELPYRCSLCDFMCSEQKKLSEHFSSFHNENYQLWCPVCFKIFNLMETKQDRSSYADLNHFTQHLLRHLQKQFVVKCPKCATFFINTMAVEEHLKNNHCVPMNKAGVERYSSVITEQDTRVVRDRTQSAGAFQSNISRSSKTIVKMYNSTPTEEIHIDGILPSFKCIDCEGALIHHKYNRRFNCKKCAYSSFCEQAVRYHMIDFHTKDFLKNSLRKYQENSTYCPCGYFSKFGNKMAKHFDDCKYQLVEACGENIINNDVTSSVLLKKTVSVYQIQSTPSVLLSVGLIKR